MRAMISIDSGETADANVRPLNVATGSGRISTGGCWYSSPSYCIVPVSRASSSAWLYSLNRRRDSPIGTRKPTNSFWPSPRPRPRIARPPDRWSSTENCSATRSGSCHGRTVTNVPSLIRVVWAASHDRTIDCCEVSW